MQIIGVEVSCTSYSEAVSDISLWANKRESRFICAANVHMVMEAYDSSDYCKVVNNADLVTPDGMPLVWMLRLKGEYQQERVYGPTLMLHILENAEKNGIPIGFLGSTPEVVSALIDRMRIKFPELKILFHISPPFRPTTEDENNQIVDQILKSGVRILFLGLGCPKQEIWMAEHKGKIPAVMVGVGAAFDFHAGVKPQSPPFLQKLGLEWLFRLFHEPRRLWKRYLYNNPRFIILAIADLLGLYHPAKMK